MQTVAWVTLVTATLIIAAAALGLIRVIFHLMAVKSALGKVAAGAAVIAAKTATVPTVVPSVNASLQPVRDFCDSI